jgi:hypothetical protein
MCHMSRNFAEQTGCGAVTVWYGRPVIATEIKHLMYDTRRGGLWSCSYTTRPQSQ